ncbi:TPA: hypothetical protein ACNV3W_003625 [Raoultella ornithinolytica]|uniref:hypothetical protein n=1 Tax=Raoultella TaxID=160674 RepID=UPI001A35CE10|nr:hypothetical protein [Raoultella ornithinolytica]HCB1497306.1 hypothetical protein [Klebsiella michiganensis]HCB1844503.1 hypothetical protein [Klebsiella oxytoca]HAZ3451783.1 hypothetical protein [Raoultella ornithinolytica]HCD1182331.1 hypothetical protein [Raoultella ornithinolytica]
MLKNATIEAVILEMARKEGIEMNGQDRVLVRTRVAASLAAKDRHRQRMTAPTFQWKKPTSPRR